MSCGFSVVAGVRAGEKVVRAAGILAAVVAGIRAVDRPAVAAVRRAGAAAGMTVVVAVAAPTGVPRQMMVRRLPGMTTFRSSRGGLWHRRGLEVPC